MVEAIIASSNRDKIKEIEGIINLSQIKFLTFKDFDNWPLIEETGQTIKENAVLKAKTIAEKFQLPALADDSGLEVDALDGAPGIYSSRYAGKDATYDDNNQKLLSELSGVPEDKRGARFKCCAAYFNNGGVLICEGVLEGVIGFETRGTCGFGYDPLFIPLGYDKTVAELSKDEKNRISHRGKAFRKMRQLLQKELEEETD